MTAKLVLVDDDEKIATLSSASLEAKGYVVKTFTDPNLAFDFVMQDLSYKILISDNIMPGLNGQDLIEKCFAKRDDLKAILATGDDAYGFDFSHHNNRVIIVSKPFKRKDLIETIEKLLSNP